MILLWACSTSITAVITSVAAYWIGYRTAVKSVCSGAMTTSAAATESFETLSSDKKRLEEFA